MCCWYLLPIVTFVHTCLSTVFKQKASPSLHALAPLPHSSKVSVPSRWSVNLAGRPEHCPMKKISADHFNSGRDVLNTQLDRFSSSWRNSVSDGVRNTKNVTRLCPCSVKLDNSTDLWRQDPIQPKWRFHLKKMTAAYHPTLSTRVLIRHLGIAGKRQMTPCVATACPFTCTTHWGVSSLPVTCTCWRRFLLVRRSIQRSKVTQPKGQDLQSFLVFWHL